ncbi:LVIVD repeat-containing protein [Desulfatibacillum aliphaticivorans]|uniref:LVIVD repeat-containing protein n=1 Tax=Desulfatibacillum aliphaticivorans TaxID=218208 RepID=UPI00041917B0|nr:hypothetical protein [Desulfatibacillum aliphaticivorans]
MPRPGLRPYSMMKIAVAITFILCLFSASVHAESWSIEPAGSIGGWRGAIAQSGDYAYFAEGQALRTADLTGDAPEIVASLSLSGEPAAVLASGNYVYVAGVNQFVVVDVSDPLSPEEAGSCQVLSEGLGRGGVSMDGDRIYLAFDTSGADFTLQVVDISTPGAPSVITSTTLIPADRILVSNNLLYAACEDTNFRIYNVSDLDNIRELGAYSPVCPGYTMAKKGSFIYISCGYESQNGVQIIDVSDTSAPYKETEYTYTDMRAYGVDFYGEMTYIAGNDAGLVVVNLTDPTDPVFQGQFDEGYGISNLIVDYPYAYLISTKDQALTKVAIDDLSDITANGSGFSPSYANVLVLDGTTLFMGAGQALWAYDMTDPNSPVLIGRWTDYAGIQKMAVENGRLYGLISNDLYVLDVSDPASGVSLLGTYDPGTYPTKMAVYNGVVYLVETDGDMLVINASAAPTFSVVQDATLYGSVQDLYVDEDLLLLAGAPSSSGQTAVYEIDESGALIPDAVIPADYGNVRCAVKNGCVAVASHTGYAGSGTANGSLGLYHIVLGSGTEMDKIAIPGMQFDDLYVSPLEGDDLLVLASGYWDENGRKSSGNTTNGTHTFTYASETQTITKGDVCKSPYPTGMTVVSTPSGGSMLATCDMSYGNYTQTVKVGDGLCCLTTKILPVEAQQDGCSVTPPSWGRGECGTEVTLTADEVSPWNFKEWTGAAAGSNREVDVTVSGDCSEAVAHFVMPVLTLAAGGGNPAYNEVYGQNPDNEKEKVAAVINLSVNDVDDWRVNSVSFTASGSGNEKDDIATVNLYLGGAGGNLLSSGTYSADDGVIALGVNQTINKGESITLTLTYLFNEDKACPCNDYSTNINVSQVNALPLVYANYKKVPPLPQGVASGPLTIKTGIMTEIDGDQQYGEKEQPLPKAYKLQVSRQHPDCVDKIHWELMPEAAKFGAKFSNGGTSIDTQVDASGLTETTLTLGEKVGMKNPYVANAFIYSTGAQCYASSAGMPFTSYGAGVDVALTPEHDGAAGSSVVSTFVSDISASNKMTIKIDMAPTDFAEVQQVKYDIGSSLKNGTMVTQNKEYYATYDMKDFSKTEPFVVTLVMEKDGKIIEQEENYELKALNLPSWFGFLESISEQINKDWNSNDEYYFVTFEYPTNFVWADYVPSSMGFLGGLDFDLGVEFVGEADYFITEKSRFSAKCNSEPKLLGQKISLKGELVGNFDEKFLFQRGTGKIEATTTFDLPSKGFSKTFVVYAVPITVSVDISGNVEIYVNGNAVLNKKLQIERAVVTPGTTITGDLTLSLAAVLGLAKISATGSPSVNMEITINYKNAGGTTTTWGAEVKVPIKICGSLFWGLASSELYSTELGPWSFNKGRKGLLDYPHLTVDDISVPRLMTTSSLSANSSGRRIAVWIDDAEPGEAEPNPDVFFRYFDGANWTSPAALIGLDSPNSEWETDPRVVFMDGNYALAAWTTNDGDPSLDNLNDILAAQDIDYAVWNGAAWSVPARVVDDDNADGSVSLAYDPSNAKVLAAWVHDVDNSNSVTTRTDWIIQYSAYDIAGDVWPAASTITGTASGSADFCPALASNSDGQGLLVWCRDDDGLSYTELDEITDGSNVDYTNTDANVYWAYWNGTGFTTGLSLTAPDSATETACDVACGPVDLAYSKDAGPETHTLAIAVWTSSTADAKTLYYSVFDFDAMQWGEPGVITQNTSYIEDPKVVVDSLGAASVIWRAADDVEGDLYMSKAGDLTNPVWSEPKKVTDDQNVQTSPSLAVGANDEVVASFNSYDMGAGDAVSGSGFTGSMNVAPANPETASLAGNWSDAGQDLDVDGLYEALIVSLDAAIAQAGDYEVRADLYSDYGKITDASVQFTAASALTETVQLAFDGAYIGDQQVDGPYYMRNFRILDNNASSVLAASDSAPYTTAEYAYTDFISGPLSLDKEEYLGTADSMGVTLTRIALNTDPGVAETAQVKVLSSMEPNGITVELTETGADTGIFTGTVSFTLGQSISDPPAIYVLDHSVVQAVWYDESNYPWKATGVWTADILQGDLDLNGVSGMADAITILQVLSGLDPEYDIKGYTSAEPWLGEEEALSTMDALYILQTVSQE